MIRTSLVFATRCLLLSVVLLASCTQAAPGTSAPVAPPDAIAADHLRTRIVAFANSLHAPSDSSAERVETAFGVKLGPPKSPGFPSRSAWKNPLSDGSLYGIEVIPSEQGFSSVLITLSTPKGEDPSRRATTYCLFDGDALAKELTASGYTQDVDLPYRGATKRIFYRRLNAQQVFNANLILYRTSEGDEGRECVSGVNISGGNT